MAKINRRRSFLFIFLIIIASFFSWRSLAFQGYFSMHDDMQFMRLYQMDKCFKDGQIPCRWVPDLGFGYGYPLFNYYPPFSYYLGEIFHLLGFSIIDSVKIVFALSLVFSGLFMYFLAREFWGEFGGLISALFYIYAPYRAVDVYVRGAMAEGWGLVWFPLIFLAVWKVIREKKFFWVLVLAVSYGFLLISHNLMSLLFSFVALVWGLFWLFYFKEFKSIKNLALGVALALGISAFFVLPVIFEKKLVHVETMLMGYFNYLAHFADLRQLFLNSKWGWGASVWGPEDEMPFMIGYLHWGITVVNFLLVWFLWFKKEKEKFLLSLFLVFFFLFAAFMTRKNFRISSISLAVFRACSFFFFIFFWGGYQFVKTKKIKICNLFCFGNWCYFFECQLFSSREIFF